MNSKKDKKIGLYFGSFNPIHVGHLIIANYLVEFSDLDEIWFVVSPHNPLKKKSSLLADYHRLALVRIAIEDNPKFKASDIEFKLSQPSYTAVTLEYLHEKYPSFQFALIMGADSLESLHKWKNYEAILNYYQIYVYPRPNIGETQFDNHPMIHKVNAPLVEISSSFIREAISHGKNVSYFLTSPVLKYLEEMNFYKKH